MTMEENYAVINPKLFNTVSPIFKLSRIMGLYPITCQKILKTYKLTWSWKIYIINSITISIFASWAIWGFINDMTAASFLSLGFRGTIDFFITSFEVSEIVSSGFYFVVSTPFRAKNFQIILKNFEKIDTIVPPTSTEEVRKKSIFFRSGVIVFLIILYILDLFMWGNDSWAGLNNYFAYYVLCTVGITHELQYWHLVSLMQDRVIAFNDKIRSNIERSKVLDNVQDIIKIHDCVCDTVDAINSCFNISASLLILSCYINLVVCPYVLFVMMTSNEINVLNFVYFIWIFLHISRIMVLVNVCHSCEEENQKTNGLILRLLISELGVDMKNEIKVLAKKVCRKKIRFSSYGLSKIDRRLILSIISSISTYWMILMQYSSRLD